MGNWASSIQKLISSAFSPKSTCVSIYDYIAKSQDEDGYAEEFLPDNKQYSEGSADFSWEAGASDNIFLHHGNPETPVYILKQAINFITEIAETDSKKAKSSLYKLVCQWHVVHLVDNLVKELVKKSDSVPAMPYLYNYAKSLAFESPDREPVKLGITLLGIVGCDKEDIQKITAIAKHEEFTIYCIITLHAVLQSPDRSIWNIAQHTTGWGRINCVEKLSQTKDEEIMNWLIRSGYRNTIMLEYTAYICAEAGMLNKRLTPDIIDAELLDCATDIIYAMLNDGPDKGIDDFKDTAELFKNYTRHIFFRGDQIKQLALMLKIQNYLTQDDVDWRQRRKGGLTVAFREELVESINKVLALPIWKSVVSDAVKKSTQYVDDDLLTVVNYFDTEYFGLCMWEANLRKVKSNPLNPEYWKALFKAISTEKDDLQIDVVIELVSTSLPWGSICFPADNDDIIDSDRINECIGEVLGGLKKYPSKGEELLSCMLKSPLIKNRNSALQVISAWDKKNWDSKIKSLLSQAYENESNIDTKKRISLLLDY